MVNLIFREGNRHVDPSWGTQPSLARKCAAMTNNHVSKLTCPIHKARSRATLLVDVAAGSEAWDIVDYCCEDFCDMIAKQVPPPWNHRKLQQAA